jgi:hypothetical protein
MRRLRSRYSLRSSSAREPPFGATAKASASVSWAVQSRLIWRPMIGVGSRGLPTDQTFISYLRSSGECRAKFRQPRHIVIVQ